MRRGGSGKPTPCGQSWGVVAAQHINVTVAEGAVVKVPVVSGHPCKDFGDDVKDVFGNEVVDVGIGKEMTCQRDVVKDGNPGTLGLDPHADGVCARAFGGNDGQRKLIRFVEKGNGKVCRVDHDGRRFLGLWSC